MMFLTLLKKYGFIGITLFALSCKKNNESGLSKPNFVFILVDDLGWTDVGYNGSTFYITPNIDEFATQSVQFTNAYASGSVCSPTRAAILTGKHPARLNITDWLPGRDPKNRKLLGPKDLDQLPLAEITLAEVLKNNGYATFFAGKWHLGGEGFHPENQGFDINKGGYDVGAPKGSGYYVPYNNPKLADGPKGEYLTDRLTDEALTFLADADENPFLLYLSFYNVHTPIQPNLQYIDTFKEKALKVGKLEKREEGEGVSILTQQNAEYASMVHAVDQNIGRLLHYLKEKKLYDNTVIVFTSDNGGLSTLLKSYETDAPTSVLPLRGGKGWLYEGGIRVPLLIKPAHFNDKGHVSDLPVVSHDFFPTFHTMAGLTLENPETIDGKDITPILHRKSWNLDRKEIFWHFPHYHGSAWKPGAAIRQGDWKLIEFYESEKVELYNLKSDLGEMNEVSSKYPDKTRQLINRLHELQVEVNAKKVRVNPEYHNNSQ